MSNLWRLSIAIPLSLRCYALNLSVREVVARCRDRLLSKHLVHYLRTVPKGKMGDPVSGGTLSRRFSAYRDQAGIKTMPGKTPATFHEQRSLSERLYREQGIDTMVLLGHSSQKMTDLYHDERDNKWVVLAI